MRKDWALGPGGGHVFGGLMVMAVGVVFLLNNLGIIEARAIFRMWFVPFVLIALGVAQLLRRGSNQ